MISSEGTPDSVVRPGSGLIDLRLTRHCVALLGEHNGKYPDANGLLVQGSNCSALIEPTLGVRRRLEEGDLTPLGTEDLVLLSHCHEDHIPALPRLREPTCWVHELDRPGLRDLESFLDVFGYAEPQRQRFAQLALEKFHFEPRPDANGFEGGARWDLGGVVIEAIHAPGHTPGHCFFEISPDGVIYLGDVDLSTFGPYYGDAASSVDDFERTLEMAASLEADWFVTGHHKGVIEGTERFREMNQRYLASLHRREQTLFDFLDEPRTLQEIVAHRLVYRPRDRGAMIDHVEEISARQHLERLERRRLIRRLPGDESDHPRYVQRDR